MALFYGFLGLGITEIIILLILLPVCAIIFLGVVLLAIALIKKPKKTSGPRRAPEQNSLESQKESEEKY